MAVGTLGTITSSPLNTSTATLDFSHTVDSGTILLYLAIHMEGNEAMSAAPIWDEATANEVFTLINDSGVLTASDVRVYTYGLINPTAKTATIKVRLSSPGNPSWCGARNYDGCESASVAAATNHLSDHADTTNTDLAVHASAGSAGNALVMSGSLQGGDGSPAAQTVGTAFTELVDANTGTTGTAEFSVWYGELLNSAPSAISVQWGVLDQHTSSFTEIVAAAVAGGGIINQLQGSNLGADLYNGALQ